MEATQKIARLIFNHGFQKIKAGDKVLEEYMMLSKTLIEVDDLNMAEQLRERRFPPTAAERKRCIQSPHFDLDTQKIVDPVHLPELLNEVNLNTKIPLFEKEMLIYRLKDQGNSKTYTKEDEKAIIESV